MIHDTLHQIIHQHIDKYIAENQQTEYYHTTTTRGSFLIARDGNKILASGSDIHVGWEVKTQGLSDAEILILRTAKWSQLIRPKDRRSAEVNLPEMRAVATRHLDLNQTGIDFISVGYSLKIELTDPQFLEKLEQIFQNEQGLKQDIERLRPISSKEQTLPDTINLWELI